MGYRFMPLVSTLACEKYRPKFYIQLCQELIRLKYLWYVVGGFYGGSVVKNLPTMQKTQERWNQSLGWKDPMEKELETHPSILAWRIDGQMSMAGHSPWGHKELDTTERLNTSTSRK